MKKILFAIASLAVLCSCAQKVELTKSGIDPKDFDSEYDGAKTALFTLTNANGMEVCVTNFGGRIVSIMVPDVNGEFKDVVLGFDKVCDYFPENNLSDFGASIGRYANRIKAGEFTLDGQTYSLPKNNNGNCLHGGFKGWQYAVYEAVESSENSVKLKLVSPDGDNGFPGEVTAFVTFTLTEDNAIDIAYEATADKATVINMTNHSYFNLSGDPANHSVVDDYMMVNSCCFTPTDELLIPTGEIASLEDTPLDFKQPKRIGDRIDETEFQAIAFAGGYDHNWILCNKGDITVPAATVICPESGIAMNVYTDEPGIQIYSGNFLDGTVTGKKGVVYNKRAAICLESQHYPDTPNQPEWPSVVLRPGETYTSHCIYEFGVVKPCCLEKIKGGEACGDECCSEDKCEK